MGVPLSALAIRSNAREASSYQNRFDRLEGACRSLVACEVTLYGHDARSTDVFPTNAGTLRDKHRAGRVC